MPPSDFNPDGYIRETDRLSNKWVAILCVVVFVVGYAAGMSDA